jgi:hypothetical protein
MSSVTMAAENVQFSVQPESLFAQVNPGYKITRTSDGKEIAMPSYFDSVARADFEFKFTDDKIYVYGEWSQRYAGGAAYTDAPWARIGYNLSPIQFIEIGNVWIGAPFAYEFNGIRTQTTSWGLEHAWCCGSANGGIKYNHYLGANGNLMVAYYNVDTVIGGPGTSIDAAYSVDFGPVGLRLGYDSASGLAQPTKADTTDPEAIASSRQYVGVKYKISDTMSVSLDLIMTSVNAANYAALGGSKDDTMSQTKMPIVFKMDGLGPGNLKFLYSTITQTGYASGPTNIYWGTVPWVKDHKYTQTNMNLFYQIPLSKKGGVEFLYLDQKANVEDKNGNKAVDSAVGPTAIGGGFYARF